MADPDRRPTKAHFRINCKNNPQKHSLSQRFEATFWHVFKPEKRASAQKKTQLSLLAHPSALTRPGAAAPAPAVSSDQGQRQQQGQGQGQGQGRHRGSGASVQAQVEAGVVDVDLPAEVPVGVALRGVRCVNLLYLKQKLQNLTEKTLAQNKPLRICGKTHDKSRRITQK